MTQQDDNRPLRIMTAVTLLVSLGARPDDASWMVRAAVEMGLEDADDQTKLEIRATTDQAIGDALRSMR